MFDEGLLGASDFGDFGFDMGVLVEPGVEFDVDVYFPKQKCYCNLGEISPVVRALAQEQFDNYVKRVRLFAHPQVTEEIRKVRDLAGLIEKAVCAVDD